MDADRLYRLDLFRDFDRRELDILASLMQDRDLDAGEVVFRQGDRAASCFFVVEGEVEVAIDGGAGELKTVSTLPTGALFGEVALVDGGLRSATCVAGPRGARLAALGRAEFDRIFNAGNPFAYKLMDVIGERVVEHLRAASSQLLDVVLAEREKRADESAN
jgi:CRP-like cAMP-binding protein